MSFTTGLHRALGQDTIFALSTAPGRAALAVIRVAGPQSLFVLRKLSRAKIQERKVTRTRLRHPDTKEHLDDGLFVYYRGPKSFTGSDTVEFNVHGAGPTVRAVLDAIAACNERGVDGTTSRIRPALPGEFARMAFEAGKLDLTELEGLSHLLNARTEAQRKLALSQSGGALKRLTDRWRQSLIQVMASIEAIIDFGDDEEIHDFEAGRTQLRDLERQLSKFLDDGRRGEILTRGIKLTIFGPPNAGKSSLLNKLVGRNAAIVSPEAGTTRDVIEVTLDIGGFPVIVGDTAGIRSGDNVGIVETQGVALAKSQIASADLKLLVVDGLSAGDAAKFVDDSTMVLLNKIDKRPLSPELISQFACSFQPPLSMDLIWPMSLSSGEGYDAFLNAFEHFIKSRFDTSGTSAHEGTVVTETRHRFHLTSCLAHLSQAQSLLDRHAELVLVAEELRLAVRSLGVVVGLVDVEEILDSLFSTFCIGK